MNESNNIVSSVKRKIAEIDPEAKIILFGSRARNDFKVDSDWDFLVLTKKRITRELKERIFDIFFEIELETDSIVTGIIKDRNEWRKYSNQPIFKNIAKDGVEI